MIVPATDHPPTLPRCRAALDDALGGDDEVIVVDGPPDLSAAAARNEGARRATGDALVFVDADVTVHADALSRIRTTLSERPGLDAVFGSYDDAPAVPTTVSTFRNLLHHHVHHSSPGPAETFWSGLGAVRRDAFHVVGGFDQARYPHPSIEDVDLGTRMVAGGARIELDPAIQGTHLKAWTLRSMLWTDFARRGVPWVRLLLRRRRASDALNLGWRHRLSALASVLAVVGALVRRPRVVAAALLALAGLNHRFYALLARRQGPGGAAAGVVLHGLHHLAAAAAVPVGLLAHLLSRRHR